MLHHPLVDVCAIGPFIDPIVYVYTVRKSSCNRIDTDRCVDPCLEHETDCEFGEYNAIFDVQGDHLLYTIIAYLSYVLEIRLLVDVHYTFLHKTHVKLVFECEWDVWLAFDQRIPLAVVIYGEFIGEP